MTLVLPSRSGFLALRTHCGVVLFLLGPGLEASPHQPSVCSAPASCRWPQRAQHPLPAARWPARLPLIMAPLSRPSWTQAWSLLTPAGCRGTERGADSPVLVTQDKAHCAAHRLPSQAPCGRTGFPGQLAFFLERLLCASQSQHFGNDPVWLECLLSVQEAHGPTPSTK